MDFFLDLLILLSCGFILGTERSNSHNIIGVRTISLVLLGSFMFTYISTKVGGDPARIIAQVVTGIGFLGAGLIFKDNSRNIQNLTTAVLVWCISALGCITALSMRFEALMFTLIIYIILKIYKRLIAK